MMDVEKIAAGLSEAQREVMSKPVAGVIAGMFYCSSSAPLIDQLHEMGLCRARFEPGDFASRGYAHAAREIEAGYAVRNHILAGDVK